MPGARLARRRYGKSAIAEASIDFSQYLRAVTPARTQNRIAHKTRLSGEASNDHEDDSQCRKADCGLVDVGVKLIENGSIVMGKFPSHEKMPSALGNRAGCAAREARNSWSSSCASSRIGLRSARSRRWLTTEK